MRGMWYVTLSQQVSTNVALTEEVVLPSGPAFSVLLLEAPV